MWLYPQDTGLGQQVCTVLTSQTPCGNASCSPASPETQEKFHHVLTHGLWLLDPNRASFGSCSTKSDTHLNIFFFICVFFFKMK